MWSVSKKFTFEASHQLPNHDGKCKRLHGHSWVGWAYCASSQIQTNGAKQGMVVDYGDIKKVLTPLVEAYLDHWHLNETTGLVNPTSEELARWIFNQVKPSLPALVAIEIQETCTSSCIYAPGIREYELFNMRQLQYTRNQ